ncbi:long chain acyl-coa synthetase [Methanosarcina thermophila]|uniref:Long chain acyl-coa synthetase n=1 Tax=Methanosarcina thermophila TaxID=2210 RepID=A0A3G9CQC0_METTE|nr:long chain acyl-coa synthetase [Methanosarcina thermophila]
MKTTISNDKCFSTWAKQTCTNHLEILEHMRKSTDPMDRAIAKRIMQTAGAENID